MKRILVITASVLVLFYLLTGLAYSSISANVVDEFRLKLWNGAYYASVRFPNGQTQELKSDTDITYTQWQVKIKAAWKAIQNPPAPVEPVTLDAATTEQLAAKIKELGLTAKDLGL